MPQVFSAGAGVTVYIHYSMTSANSQTIDWDASFERIGDSILDVDADSFAAVQSVNGTTVPATSGQVDIVQIPFTSGAQMDNVVAGDFFRLKITRDAASDVINTDAEVHAVELRET
jgi:hypothetical protein